MSRKEIKRKQDADIELAQDLPVFVPSADIFEKEDAILVVCDMPGVDDQHIGVTLDNDELTLTGYQETKEPEGYELIHQGYMTGIFRRTFTLTSEIDREKIEAKISNGIIKLILPKAEETHPRKIAVTAG